MSKAVRSAHGSPQAGITLLEIMVVLFFISLGTGLFASSMAKNAARKADLNALKLMLDIASSQSVTESKHFGIHVNPTLKTIGLFQDKNQDNAFSGTDTLSSQLTLDPRSKISMVDASSQPATDVCFKKNGAVASGTSYAITYVGSRGDTSVFQIIAASGRVFDHAL